MDAGLVIVVVVGPAVMLLVAAVSWLAAAGRLRRNGFVGLRLPSTMSSDAGWIAGHRAAVRPALVAAVLLVAAGGIAVLIARSIGAESLTIVLVVVLLVTIAVVTVLADRAASNASPT